MHASHLPSSARACTTQASRCSVPSSVHTVAHVVVVVLLEITVLEYMHGFHCPTGCRSHNAFHKHVTGLVHGAVLEFHVDLVWECLVAVVVSHVVSAAIRADATLRQHAVVRMDAGRRRPPRCRHRRLGGRRPLRAIRPSVDAGIRELVVDRLEAVLNEQTLVRVAVASWWLSLWSSAWTTLS